LPVHVGTIELESREQAVTARGEIGGDGRFVLSTFKPGDGAVAGMHDCVVVQMVIVEDISNFRPITGGVIHPRFDSYATSGLVCEVSDNIENDFDHLRRTIQVSRAWRNNFAAQS